jgi:hypothetical protein
MDSEPALRRIEESIGPLIGRHMAKASVQVQCQKLGVTGGQISPQQLRAVLEGIGKGMFVLVGQEKTKSLLRELEKSLGIEGVTT